MVGDLECTQKKVPAGAALTGVMSTYGLPSFFTMAATAYAISHARMICKDPPILLTVLDVKLQQQRGCSGSVRGGKSIRKMQKLAFLLVQLSC